MAQNVFQMHRMRHDAQYENLQGLQQNALLRGVSLTKFIPPPRHSHPPLNPPPPMNNCGAALWGQSR